MSTAEQLRRLADLVERVENESVTVREVTQRPREDGRLVADLTLELSEAVPGDTTDVPNRSTGTDESTGVGSSAAAVVGGGEQQDPTDSAAESTAEADATRTAAVPTARESAGAGAAGQATDPDAPDGTATESVGTVEDRPNAGDRSSDAGDDQPDGTDAGATGADTPDGSATTAGDGGVSCRVSGCAKTFDTRHGMRVHAAKAHQDEGDGAPVYTDPEALREAYEHGDTFAEMTAFLGVDVTPATVRRHMVDHGIHVPSSRSGAGLEPSEQDPDTDEGADPAPATEEDGAPGTAEDRATEEPDEPGEPATDAGETGSDSTAAADDAAASGAGASRSESAVDDPSTSGSGADGPEPNGTETPADPAETDDTEKSGGAATNDTGDQVGDDRVDGDEGLPEPGEDLSFTLAAVHDTVCESVDLPEGVTLRGVVDAVESGRTLYDVSEELGLDRSATRQLLTELELIDLVTGRLSERPRNEETATRIDARLRRFAEGTQEAH